mgnify:CR=1 FL=1
MKVLLNFLQSKTNESLKRLIAIMFSITLIAIILLFCGSVIWLLYFGKSITEIKAIIEILIYCFVALIALLLSLATAETIVSLFKKDN